MLTVKQVVFHALGLFAEVFPEQMVPYTDKLVGVYMHNLKTEVGNG